MQARTKTIRSICAGCLFLTGMNIAGCIKPYNPNIQSPATGYLVVEGNLNAAPAPTTITLSRTEPLTDTASQVFENGASVTVECSDGTTDPAVFGGNGTYNFGVLPLDSTKTYRLSIRTQDGNQYYSKYVPVIPNPPIDSVNVTFEGDGAHFSVNTHNPAGNTRYYMWSYAGTWEFHSAEYSFYVYQGDTVALRTPAQQVYTCWRGETSTNLLIYSTAKLSQDVVSQFPILTIPQGDQRLSVEYSLFVTQYALGDSAFDYLQLMQSNTENLGSIFDPLPSSLTGNIYCATTPSLQVVGYVNASAVQTTRIFVTRPVYWQYYFTYSFPDTTLPGTPQALERNFSGTAPIYTPITVPSQPGSGWISNFSTCISCIAMGGTTTKPPFWP